jgi:hypothetical protein
MVNLEVVNLRRHARRPRLHHRHYASRIKADRLLRDLDHPPWIAEN